MQVQQSTQREELVETLVAKGEGTLDREVAKNIVDGFTDEQVVEAAESFRKADVAKAELRDRLRSTPVLCQAVCPAKTWKTDRDRYDVATGAIRLLDATAEKHGVTPEALAQGLVETGGTIQDTIDTHGTDPRIDGFLGGPRGYYAFRYRLGDAIQHVKADEIAAEAKRREAAREAAWAARGEERCDRCGGAGGANHWPGFTCYDCGGRGSVPARS